MCFPMGGDIGCNILLFDVMKVADKVSRFYMGHFPMKTKFGANIGCVKSLKWSHVR